MASIPTNWKLSVTISVLSLTAVLIIYSFKIRNEDKTPINNHEAQNLNETSPKNASTSIKTKAIKRPSNGKNNLYCIDNYYFKVLYKLIEELQELETRKTTCLPSEKNYYVTLERQLNDKQMNNNSKWREKVDSEERGIGVVWCVVGLLFISVIAAIVDVCNARTMKLEKTNSMDIPGNPAAYANRRCSLAALTVSRHIRRQAYGSRRPASVTESPGMSNKDPGTLRAKLV